MEEESKTFNRGDVVAEEGEYICVPCGYKKHYTQGDTFEECISCMKKAEAGGEEIAGGLELWEKLH